MVDFGTDTSCLTGLRTGRFASGPRLVAESLFRRFRTTQGTLRGGEAEQNFGFNLADLIGSVQTPSDQAALPGRVEAEALKDERVDTVTVTMLQAQVGPGLSWTIGIEGDTAEGPFSLVLAVSAVTVEVLGILPES